MIVMILAVMLLVVMPVIALALYFAWRERVSRAGAARAPVWRQPARTDLVWIVPIALGAVIAALVATTTHVLDPCMLILSRPAPVRVEVVALNRKWLFIYPDYGIASVNRLQLPVDTPVEFKLTADAMMTSFYIPSLGNQVYAMPGLQTRLRLIANHTGTFNAMSAANRGSGFSDVPFDAVSSTRAQFDAWVAHVRRAPATLDRGSYAALARDTRGHPATLFKATTPGLFDGIVRQYPDRAVTPR